MSEGFEEIVRSLLVEWVCNRVRRVWRSARRADRARSRVRGLSPVSRINGPRLREAAFLPRCTKGPHSVQRRRWQVELSPCHRLRSEPRQEKRDETKMRQRSDLGIVSGAVRTDHRPLNHARLVVFLRAAVVPHCVAATLELSYAAIWALDAVQRTH